MQRRARTEEVAEALHVKPATVRKYAREGRLPFDSTPGGHRRYDIEEVVAAMLPAREADVGSDGDLPVAAALDTPFVSIPSKARYHVTVRATAVHTQPMYAHGTREQNELWAMELPVE